MKIDTSKIENYAGMTAEQKVAALEAFEHSDPDMSGFVKKSVFDAAASEAASWKKKYNEQLTEEERKAAELAEKQASMEQELITLRRDKKIGENRSQYLSLGYSDAEALEAANAMADGDNAKVFEVQKKFLENQKKTIEAAALNQQPSLSKGEAFVGKTAEQIAENKLRENFGLPPKKTE